MASLLKKTVKPSGGDYTTLQAAIAANAKDLRAGTGSDEYLEIEISGDWSVIVSDPVPWRFLDAWINVEKGTA